MTIGNFKYFFIRPVPGFRPAFDGVNYLTRFLFQATGIALTSGVDQLLVLTFPGNDLVICFHNPGNEDRVTEALGVAFQRMRK
jgi:hypothetical protein